MPLQLHPPNLNLQTPPAMATLNQAFSPSPPTLEALDNLLRPAPPLPRAPQSLGRFIPRIEWTAVSAALYIYALGFVVWWYLVQ